MSASVARSSTGPPTAKARRRRKSSSSSSSGKDFCSLGLRRIIDENLQIGPIISLKHKMYLGRSPKTMVDAMKAHKSLDATWTATDVRVFQKKHPRYHQFAMLNIDCEQAESFAVAATTTTTTTTKMTPETDEDGNNNSNINNNSYTKHLISVSRKLLTVVASTTTSITLKRGLEPTTLAGNKAREVRVRVTKRKKLREVQSKQPTAALRKSSPEDDSSSSSSLDVASSQSVTLEEGDVLMILNSNYRYLVVKNTPSSTPATKPQSRMAGTTTIGTTPEKAIELSDNSGSSSDDNDDDDDKKPRARTTLAGRTPERAIQLSDGSDSDNAQKPRARLFPTTTSIGRTPEKAIDLSDDSKPQQNAVVDLLLTSSNSSNDDDDDDDDDDLFVNDDHLSDNGDNDNDSDNNKPQQDAVVDLLLASSSSSSNDDKDDAQPPAARSSTSPKATTASTDATRVEIASPRENTETASTEKDKTVSTNPEPAANKKPEPTTEPETPVADKKPDPRTIRPARRTSPRIKSPTKPYTPVATRPTRRTTPRTKSSTKPETPVANGKLEPRTIRPRRLTSPKKTRAKSPAKSPAKLETPVADKKPEPRALRSSSRTKSPTKPETPAADKKPEPRALRPRRLTSPKKTRTKSPAKPGTPVANKKAGTRTSRSKSPKTKSPIKQETPVAMTSLRSHLLQGSVKVQRVEFLPSQSLRSLLQQTRAPENDEKDLTPLESPTRKFWDSSWSSSRKKRKTEKTESPATTIPCVVSPPPKEALPPPRDLLISTANMHWKSIQCSRPREGALFLHANLLAANKIPSPTLCKDLMEFLTWGYQQYVPALNTTRPFWDGPKMEYTFGVWKSAVGRHPSLLLPRMVDCAPGGISDWWKTCLHHHDEWIMHEDRTEQEREPGIIGMLRLRSARLDALLYLLETNKALEDKQHEQLQEQTEDNLQQQKGDDKEGDSDMSSDDEDDSDDEHPVGSSEDVQSLVFLSELRSVGNKAVLREVAQAMARFWLQHKEYLGYYDDASGSDGRLSKYYDEHMEIVTRIANQFVDVLKCLRAVLESPIAATVSPEPGRRRGRKRKATKTTGLTEKDVKDTVWNAMDLELSKHLDSKGKRKRGMEYPAPREAFLMDWLLTLREALGKETIAELSQQVGVAQEYEDMMYHNSF